MKTILVLAQKGGVGKTTIANELAFQFEDMGKIVSFVNLDNQGGQVFPSKAATADTEFQIVDTPGTLTENFKKWCRSADFVLIPTLASALDLPALERVNKMATECGTPMGIVINQYDLRGRVDREFLEYLKDEGYNVIGTLPRAAAVKQAQLKRCSINDIKTRSSAGIHFAALASAIMNKLIS